MLSKHPVLFALIFSLLLWPLLILESSILFKGTFLPAQIREHALWLGTLPGTIIGAALFILLRQQFSANDRQPHLKENKGAQIMGAYWIIAVFIALYAGLLMTLVAHGKLGPWGFVFNGIKGPLTQGFLPATIWPVVFLAGSATALYLAHRIWQKMLSLSQDPIQ